MNEVGMCEIGMGAVEAVRRRWSGLCAHRGCAAPAAAVVLDEIIRAYSEPHRHYHTLDHISTLLALLDCHADAGTDREALTAAILFHDLVYDPARQDNEAVSASLAANRLAGLGFPEGLIAKVARCILATRHEQAAATVNDADLALLLDLDLSILAVPPGTYRAYAQGVRREYAHVADTLYRPGRRRVLEGFLVRERIFLTARLRALWEAPARANLAAEIAELS